MTASPQADAPVVAPERLDPAPVAGHPLEAFYRRVGRIAISRHGALWCDAGRFTLATFPGNQRVAATKRDIQQLLVDSGKLVAVFCPAAGSGPMVREYLLRPGDPPHRPQQQFLQHVRKHAARFVSRELTWDEMAHLAPDLHHDMAARWRIAGSHWTDQGRWADICATAARTPGLWAFGCLMGESLAGYVVAWQEQDTCHGVLIHRDGRFDRYRVGNVLLHAFTAAAIARKGTSTINLGRSWYPPKPSLDSFKRHAGYDEHETVLAAVLHPRVEPLLRSTWTHRCLEAVGRLTGGRLNLDSDLQVFRAARLTEIP